MLLRSNNEIKHEDIKKKYEKLTWTCILTLITTVPVFIGNSFAVN